MIINLTMSLTGTAPLIMHNVQAADPMNAWAREMKAITAKKSNKTDADSMELDRLKFMSGLYIDAEIGPYLPGPNIFRCLMEAGSITRDGKNIERGVAMSSPYGPLEYDGPRTADALWNGGEGRFVDRRLAAVNRVRIPVVRPIFVEWRTSFDVMVEDEVIDPEKFQGIAIKAGKMIGVGDFRRFYGRFAVEIN
jgi:hypothetical protein